MKILYTGFAPFGGERVNPSFEALRLLPDSLDGAAVLRMELPTTFESAGKLLLDTIGRENPDIVICVGQAGGRAAVTPERCAINVRDARIPDNAGHQPKDEPVIAGGPAALFSTLPIKAMAAAARKDGFAAEISNSAGTFVCNDLMYSLLYTLEREFPAVRGGFIHVPACACSDQSAPIPVMPPETSAAAIEKMLAVL